MTKPHLLFHVVDMPCETGLAALFSLLDGVQLVGQKINETRSGGQLGKFVTDETRSVVLLGSYWDAELPALLDIFHGLPVLVVPCGSQVEDPVRLVAGFYQPHFLHRSRS